MGEHGKSTTLNSHKKYTNYRIIQMCELSTGWNRIKRNQWVIQGVNYAESTVFM